jgi:NAD(P)-dependent dehydrogenase (short-subunit alcohol dehydrogenase family)
VLEKSIVLITGASTGFGREIAALLSKSGYRVYGTSRHPQTGFDYPMLTLDVRSDVSVRECVDKILFVEGRIDILINNAGYVLNGPAEEASLEQVKAQFETNFFGSVRMIKAVLPTMRKQQSGKIVNISSLAGRIATPGHGLYAASKFALEAYTESLNYEINPFNIRCILIEPGYFKTNLHTAAVQAEDQKPDYDPLRKCLNPQFEKNVQAGSNPACVARLVKSILEMKSPKLRYPIGPGAPWVLWCKSFFPQKLFAWVVRKFYHLP